MTRSFGRRAEPSAPRALISSLAIAGVGAALALAAAAPTATASPSHPATSAHHATHQNTHLMVNGLIAGHHGRTVTVFAKTAKVGKTTRHNERVTVTFARSSHGRSKLRTGDHIRIAATGSASGHHFVVRHHDDETVTPAPATLFVGTVDAVTGTLLTVSENDRDNGDHQDGDDNGGHHGGGDDGAHASPADHGPGGGDNGDNDGHQITIDDTNSTITVDGQPGTIAVGDTVAALGEASSNTVVASTIYAFTTVPAFLRGEINMVNGDDVTVRDDGNSTTVSLTGVPLALNGDVGATTSQLVVGDKLLVLGTLDQSTGQITPEAAFAFNHHDDNPCGDNDGGHHGDGGSDG